MTSIPKCTSWRGHHFEARYSSVPAPRDSGRELEVHGEYALATVKSLYTIVTYERDVCTRCGASIERATQPQPQPQENGK